jgi:cytochrome c peroxidase
VLGLACVMSAGFSAQEPSPFAALPLQARGPADNPSTPAKIALGRLLFWDPILSGSQDVACATCHHPEYGYSDGRDLPIGTGGKGLGRKRSFLSNALRVATRNTPTILNVGFSGIDTSSHYEPLAAPMFWDMRVRGLEAQVFEPIEKLDEMRGRRIAAGGGMAAAIERVAAIPRYRELFRGAFGDDETVTPINLARAVAAFERALVTPDTPFDRYMRGDLQAMTPAQIRGMAAFDDHGCAKCHMGPMFSDYKVHVLSVPDSDTVPEPDAGANLTFAFRTPPLRNLAYTAPYMHSGIKSSLDDVLGHYNVVGGDARGMHNVRRNSTINGFRILGFPVGPDGLDPLLKEVNVNSQRGDIIEFLQALSAGFDRVVPAQVPSGLRPGGDID